MYPTGVHSPAEGSRLKVPVLTVPFCSNMPEGCLQDVTSPAVGIQQLLHWLQRRTLLPGGKMDMSVPHSAKTGAKTCVSLIVCSADS